MAGLPFAALVLCLHLTAGECFTINVDRRVIYVTVGDDASFSVRPSGRVSRGRWSFNGRTVARWYGQNEYVEDDYTNRAKILTSSGSLLLKSVKLSDSGEYRVDMDPFYGYETSATVTLRVIESNAIVIALLLGVPGVSLIGGACVWLILRVTGRLREPVRSKYAVNFNSGGTSTLDPNTVSTSQPYEHLPKDEQDASDNAQDGSST